MAMARGLSCALAVVLAALAGCGEDAPRLQAVACRPSSVAPGVVALAAGDAALYNGTARLDGRTFHVVARWEDLGVERLRLAHGDFEVWHGRWDERWTSADGARRVTFDTWGDACTFVRSGMVTVSDVPGEPRKWTQWRLCHDRTTDADVASFAPLAVGQSWKEGCRLTITDHVDDRFDGAVDVPYRGATRVTANATVEVPAGTFDVSVQEFAGTFGDLAYASKAWTADAACGHMVRFADDAVQLQLTDWGCARLGRPSPAPLPEPTHRPRIAACDAAGCR